MAKAKNTIKGFFAMLFCGMSAINLYTASDYTKMIPKNSMEITKESWAMTGRALKDSINHVGVQIGRK
jgi:hypothetical protein